MRYFFYNMIWALETQTIYAYRYEEVQAYDGVFFFLFCVSLQCTQFAFGKANHHLPRPSMRHQPTSHNTSHRPKYGFDIPWKSVQSKWKPDGIYMFSLWGVPSSKAKFTAAGRFIVIPVHTHASSALSETCLFSVSYLALFLVGGERICFFFTQ